MKACRSCGVVKPLDAFWRDRSRADGREGRCAECRRGGPPRAPVVGDGLRRCARCEERKPLDDFVRHKGKAGGRSSYCKPCFAERQRLKRTADPEERQRRKRRERERLRGRAVIAVPESKRCRSCHEAKPAAGFSPDRGQPDGLYSKCKACRTRWATGVDRFAIYDREGGRCHICRRRVSRERFHVEHLWPLAAGGTNEPSNLAVAHPWCNVAKSDSTGPAHLRLVV